MYTIHARYVAVLLCLMYQGVSIYYTVWFFIAKYPC